jgi:hypothetical protein
MSARIAGKCTVVGCIKHRSRRDRCRDSCACLSNPPLCSRLGNVPTPAVNERSLCAEVDGIQERENVSPVAASTNWNSPPTGRCRQRSAVGQVFARDGFTRHKPPRRCRRVDVSEMRPRPSVRTLTGSRSCILYTLWHVQTRNRPCLLSEFRQSCIGTSLGKRVVAARRAAKWRARSF